MILLNIALILYVAVCFFRYLFLRAHNKKALRSSQGEGLQFTQVTMSGAKTGERGFFFILTNSDTAFGATVGMLDVGPVVIDASRRCPLIGGSDIN
ncbi:hypothetical protein [Escherichia coli]|uniref:hypothetical protein n=1 Tax=Escherichia coli TaxID=562 RepID=UPI002739EC98|nr:hypothetical protein [Escherichia coli]